MKKNQKEFMRLKKTLKAICKKNLNFIGTHPFYIIDKYIESEKWTDSSGGMNRSSSFYIVVESVDKKYQVELLVHPKDYGRLKRTKNQKTPAPYTFAVFQYKNTNDYFVTLENNEKKGKRYLCRQARISLFALLILLLIVGYLVLFLLQFFLSFAPTR